MNPRDGRATLAALRTALEARPEVLEAYLFGSLARGEAGEMSDVDVAVFLDEQRSIAERGRLLLELTAELMSRLGRNDVDVVALNDAPPLLYHRVLRDGERLLARDLLATTRREGQALSRYCDWVPQLAKIEAAHRRRMAAGEFGR